MRKMLTTVLVAMTVLIVVGAADLAQATHIEIFNGQADCEGWRVDYQVRWRNSPIVVLSGLIDYTIVLEQDGMPVQTASGQVAITRVAGQTFVDYELAGLWTGDLCGDYTVTGEVALTTPAYPADDSDPRNQQSFTAAFNCECAPPPPPPGACHYTPGFWKNHAHLWPVTSLTLGAVTYNQAELLAIMSRPVGGDATIILAYHLIAAKLNVANGADDGIQGTIDNADAFLSDHPIGSNPRNPARSQGIALKDLLANYNEMGCPDGSSNALKSFDEDIEEPTLNWGDVKSLFR